MCPTLAWSIWMAFACGGAEVPGDADGGGVDGGGADGGAGDGGAPGEIPAILASAAVTWTLDFDAAAEAQGQADCQYSRSFQGVQRLDRGYLCPDCAVIVRGTASVTEGLDCLGLVSEPEPTRTETWGWSEAGLLYRSGVVDLSLGELAEIDPTASDGAALAWESESEAPAGGTVRLSAVGTLSWAVDPETLLPDPFPPRTTPYACGWPQADPGDLVLDYEAHLDQVFPNVRLVDPCGEELALWDLSGRWLVIDTSQPDCGPCLQMASTAAAFVEEMAAEGVEVVVVSLLGAGLAEPHLSPPAEVYDDFVESYGHGDPILVDEGFGYAVFSRLAASDLGESFGFPTWVVVDPQMRLVHGNVGFSDWDAVAQVIRSGA